jgi:uncharacterized protein (TIGR03437 family)
VNAASYSSGTISPGEIVDIFGSGLGPAVAVSSTVDASGKLPSTLGGVQVFVNGFAAPIVFVSATQVSAIVPFEIQSLAKPSVWVAYSAQTSNVLELAPAPSVPGIFTLNASGSGPAAVLNQDNSPNTSANPAAQGSIVQVFVTGEGQTSPAGVSGQITRVSAAPPLTPVPILDVSVTIGGRTAPVAFYGEAPGAVAGLMQVNAQVPSAVPSGAVPILVTVGPNTSQPGVTVFVH